MSFAPKYLASAHPLRVAAVAAVFTLAACAGDAPESDGMSDTTGMGFAAERFQAQKVTMDSMFANAKSTEVVAAELGPTYNVADEQLTATVRRESAKTWDCYTKAREEHDPNLVGVAYMLLNYGAAGWDIVRVERQEFSSVFGGVVVTCLNTRARNEWNLPTSGVKAGAHLVRLPFRPDSAPPGVN